MLTKIKKLTSPVIIQTVALLTPSVVLADELTGDVVPGATLGKVPDILAVVRAAIQFILVAAFVLAFIFLIIGGIRWIVAGGDEKGVAGARGMITSALIGLVIVLVAYALIRLVEIFFGFNIITGGITVPTIENTGGSTSP